MHPYSIIEFAEVDSTNLYARRRLRELADRTVIHAGVQSSGRGRWERSWISDVPGNLCLTVVLKPVQAPVTDLPLSNLTQLLAVSLCRVLDGHGIRATVKWPNDIQVNGRKIAGILAETEFEAEELVGLVLGIGVNLNLDAGSLAAIDQPATSLGQELGQAVDVDRFRDGLLAEFFGRYDEFLERGFGMIREEYLARFPFVGRSVEIRWPTGCAVGRVSGVSEDGALELVGPNGESRRITLGEMNSQSVNR